MAYIGNSNTTQSFTPAIDYFSGNASTTAFTLSRPVASVAQVQAVIENVPQATLEDPVLLCGSMFGLGAMCRDGVYRQLRRHRLFESNIAIAQPACWHQHPSLGVYGHGSGQGNPIKGYMANAAERAAVMGIDWMTARDIAEAIPPAYTEYIGAFIRSVL